MAHFLNLNQYEMSIANSVKEISSRRWCCKQCDSEFTSVIRVVTHLLTSCDEQSGPSTFSTESAIRVCMVLNESGSAKMHQAYIRVAGVDTNSDTPDLSKTDDEERTESGDVGGESVELVYHYHSSMALDDDAETSGPATRPPPPMIQDFSANPPASLSAEAKAEWAFRYHRAEEIRRLIKTNLKPKTGSIDHDAVLAAYNSSTRPSGWESNAPNAPPYASYGCLTVKEYRDRKRLQRLTEQAQQAEETQAVKKEGKAEKVKSKQ